MWWNKSWRGIFFRPKSDIDCAGRSYWLYRFAKITTDNISRIHRYECPNLTRICNKIDHRKSKIYRQNTLSWMSNCYLMKRTNERKIKSTKRRCNLAFWTNKEERWIGAKPCLKTWPENVILRYGMTAELSETEVKVLFKSTLVVCGNTIE
jgi:hypothetical protein